MHSHALAIQLVSAQRIAVALGLAVVCLFLVVLGEKYPRLLPPTIPALLGFMAAVYCIAAGLYLARDWQDPLRQLAAIDARAAGHAAARVAVAGHGRGGLILLAWEFWPYVLTGIGTFCAFYLYLPILRPDIPDRIHRAAYRLNQFRRRIFAGPKSPAETSTAKVLKAYSAVLSRTPSDRTIFDEALLPVPKQELRKALVRLLVLSQDQQERAALKAALLTLASFQPGAVDDSAEYTMQQAVFAEQLQTLEQLKVIGH